MNVIGLQACHQHMGPPTVSGLHREGQQRRIQALHGIYRRVFGGEFVFGLFECKRLRSRPTAPWASPCLVRGTRAPAEASISGALLLMASHHSLILWMEPLSTSVRPWEDETRKRRRRTAKRRLVGADGSRTLRYIECLSVIKIARFCNNMPLWWWGGVATWRSRSIALRHGGIWKVLIGFLPRTALSATPVMFL